MPKRLALILSAVLAGAVPMAVPAGAAAATGRAPVLSVSGNRLVTSTGATWRLLGVNRSGTEYRCIKNRTGIFEGPTGPASIAVMKAWGINAVRLPLNTECWMGNTRNPVPAFSGVHYRNAIINYANRLIRSGITPVLDLHWTPGRVTGAGAECVSALAMCQKPMPDLATAPSLWASVARHFRGNREVVFELFNEPYPDRMTTNYDAAWRCWRDGGRCPGIAYPVAGMQKMLDTVRAAGAKNVVLLSGVGYSNDTYNMLRYWPKRAANTAAAAHPYSFAGCTTTTCYNAMYSAVAAAKPLTFTEFGEVGCRSWLFTKKLLDWADSKRVGYLGWTWNTWDCATQPVMIKNYNGTPSPSGAIVRAHLRAARR